MKSRRARGPTSAAWGLAGHAATGTASPHPLKEPPMKTRPFRPCLTTLDDRICPAVTLIDDFSGLDFHIDAPSLPPDPHLAAGPRYLVEVVNNDIAFFNKNNGNPVFADSLTHFFAPLGPFSPTFDALDAFDSRVSYDELAGRFIVTSLSEDPDAQTSHLLLAVSDDADPRGAWE